MQVVETPPASGSRRISAPVLPFARPGGDRLASLRRPLPVDSLGAIRSAWWATVMSTALPEPPALPRLYLRGRKGLGVFVVVCAVVCRTVEGVLCSSLRFPLRKVGITK